MKSTIRQHDLGIEALPTDHGLVITHVSAESPAAMIGLELGDCIVSLLGYPVRPDNWGLLLSGDNGYLRLLIRDHRTGTVVTRYATSC